MHESNTTKHETTWMITTTISDAGVPYYLRMKSGLPGGNGKPMVNFDWCVDLEQGSRFFTRSHLYRMLKLALDNANGGAITVVQVNTRIHTLHEVTAYDFTQDVDFLHITLATAVQKARALLTDVECDILGITGKAAYLKLATHGVDEDA